MDELLKGLKTLGIDCSQDMINKFEGYMEGVLEWNEKINLTAITDKDEFVKKHYLDSLLCYGLPNLMNATKVIDVGTGAGFPGIPLAIVFPKKEFVLMDSLKKRLNVIDELCTELGIKNVVTLHGRAEDLARDKKHREVYDLCVSRAVANLSVLAEYTLPFIKKGGTLLAYKGPEVSKEIDESMKAIRILGGTLTEKVDVNIEGLGLNHKIVVIKKTGDTPAKYPRKAGTPTKEPLK